MNIQKISKIFIMNGDKVLLLLSKHLNKYHLPGGHLESNETFEHALQREVEEETSQKLKFFHRIGFTSYNVCLYIGKLWNNNIKLSDEHSKYIWAPVKEAHKLNVCKFTFKDLKYLQTILNVTKKTTSVDITEDENN
jgi:8-oxo-dGTP pyrophosphatase MutT (NUDIX family)